MGRSQAATLSGGYNEPVTDEVGRRRGRLNACQSTHTDPRVRVLASGKRGVYTVELQGLLLETACLAGPEATEGRTGAAGPPL